MRAALLPAGSILAVGLLCTFAATAQRETSTVEASTEQTPSAKGWDGRLPLPVYAVPDGYDDGRDYGGYGGGYGGGDVNIFIDNSIHLGGRYRLGGAGYERPECSGYDLSRGGNRRGVARTGGYISGGTYQSGPRCHDSYPGLPLRPLPYGDGRTPPAPHYTPAPGAR